MTAPVPGAVMGRPSNARRAGLLDEATDLVTDLRMEIRARDHERDWLVGQLRYASRLVMRSVLQQRDDLGTEAAGHLDHLAARLERRGTA